MLKLLIPGLIWPAPQPSPPPTDGLSLPGLDWLLSRGDLDMVANGVGLGGSLLAEAGLTNPDSVSRAWLRRLGEQPTSDATASDTHVIETLLCADPANVRFLRDQLLLADGRALSIRADEADALLDTLNAEIGALGRFFRTTPEHWYLAARKHPKARFVPLSDASGRPWARSTPDGPDAAEWQRIGNEVQILLHEHPVNRDRDARGEPLINTVWWWGSGDAPAFSPEPVRWDHWWCADPVGRALARLRDRSCSVVTDEAVPALIATAGGSDPCSALVVLDLLSEAAHQLDLTRWRAALMRLEAQWLSPLADAIRRGRRPALTVSALPVGPGTCVHLHLTAQARWRFWRRPRTLDALHQQVFAI